jgi:hypothetical protein
MTFRSIAVVALAAAFAAPLAAQEMDHTSNIKGSGKLPPGWSARFDQPGGALTQVDVRQAGTALAFRSGPAAIYWNTKDIASGSRRSRAGHGFYRHYKGLRCACA